MHYSKPLLSPNPKRRDRRAGTRSERWRKTLAAPSQPWRSDDERLGRPAGEKRRAYARLSVRYQRLLPRSLRIASGLALCLAIGALVYSVATADDLVAFDRAPEAYAALVVAVADACESGPCTFGRTAPDAPPPAIRDGMSRVRARQIGFDPATGWTTFRGGYGADARLVHAAPPTPRQQRSRAVELQYQDRVARETRRAVLVRTPVADAWTRVSRR